MDNRYGPAMAPSKLIERDKEWLRQEILLEKDPERKLAWITLNKPDKLNCLVDSHYAYLAQLMSELDWDDEVKVIIFRGAGRCFGAGHDVGALGLRHGIDPAGQGRRPSQRFRLLVDRGGGVRGEFNIVSPVLNSLKVTIAQVHGYCYGYHLFLAMACDMVVATEDASFTHPGFQYIGPTNDLGLLYQVMGLRRFKEMVLTGRAFTAQEAFQCGMLTRVVPADKLEEEVNKLAEAALALPFDGIVLGKAFIQGVLEAAGVRMGNYISNLGHALQTNMRYEPDEFNLLRERREKGVKAATYSRDAKRGEESQLRK